jgi:hypothetical protein
MTTTEAIKQSVERDEIVRLPFAQEDYDRLMAACDDHADSDIETEFWGTDWRVHMRLAEWTCDQCGRGYSSADGYAEVEGGYWCESCAAEAGIPLDNRGT